MRVGANLKQVLGEFDSFLTLGIDTKRVALGPNQGGAVKEHLVMNVQGVSGPKLLGIVTIEDGKGEKEELQSDYLYFALS